MEYTLLVLLTEDNDNYRTQLEERISDLECIEEIRYLHITDSVDLKKKSGNRKLQYKSQCEDFIFRPDRWYADI